MHVLFAIMAGVLSGCIGAPSHNLRAPAAAIGVADVPMALFGPMTADPPLRSNAAMAQDFLDLSFRLESGREIPVLSRFVAPMTVGLTGAVPPTAAHDLDLLLDRLRREAGLGITRVPDGSAASITVEFVPRAQLRARARDAACFVAPRISSWAAYRRAGRETLDWTTYSRRERVAVFIPTETAPQEIRDCLHEELAQAIGPLNDLYRLPDSVFNDDNIHATLTGFDMLMLRITYAKELVPGMTREAVALSLPGILARLNPVGNRDSVPVPPTPRSYGAAIARALGPGSSPGARRAAAEEALAISDGWHDARTGFALLTLGRLAGPGESDLAFAAFTQAEQIFLAQSLPLHAAHAQLQIAIFALSEEAWAPADSIAAQALVAATHDQNASLMAGLMMVRAEALDRLGRPAQAAQLRLDSLRWARYGMASDLDVGHRLATIAAIAARTEQVRP